MLNMNGYGLKKALDRGYLKFREIDLLEKACLYFRSLFRASKLAGVCMHAWGDGCVYKYMSTYTKKGSIQFSGVQIDAIF